LSNNAALLTSPVGVSVADVNIISCNFTNVNSNSNGTIGYITGTLNYLYIYNSYFNNLKATNGGSFYVSGCHNV
jgi:hypothetical protein